MLSEWVLVTLEKICSENIICGFKSIIYEQHRTIQKWCVKWT